MQDRVCVEPIRVDHDRVWRGDEGVHARILLVSRGQGTRETIVCLLALARATTDPLGDIGVQEHLEVRIGEDDRAPIRASTPAKPGKDTPTHSAPVTRTPAGARQPMTLAAMATR